MASVFRIWNAKLVEICNMMPMLPNSIIQLARQICKTEATLEMAHGV